jgi:hypothetical protein
MNRDLNSVKNGYSPSRAPYFRFESQFTLPGTTNAQSKKIKPLKCLLKKIFILELDGFVYSFRVKIKIECA